MRINEKLKKIISKVILICSIFSLIPTTVYASVSFEPRTFETSTQVTYININTGGNPCYYLYSPSSTIRPDIDLMYYATPSQLRDQRFEAAGEWWLWVYVPATGEWTKGGPYLKESAGPFSPEISGVPTSWTREDVTATIICKGDNGEKGRGEVGKDGIIQESFYASGFSHMEYSTGNGQYTSLGDNKQNTTMTFKNEGLHSIQVKAFDKLGTESAIISFQAKIDKTAPTLTNPTARSEGGGIRVIAPNMQDHGLSGNKCLTFKAYKGSTLLSTKTRACIVEGYDMGEVFSSSDLGGYDASTEYKIDIITEDQVGNQAIYTVTIKGNNVSVTEPEITPPSGGDPEIGEGEEDIEESSLGVIKFDPNETDWTNEGKTGEGEGEYPVEVYYDGDNPHIVKGTATKEVEKEDDEGNVTTETKEKSIKVEFPLDHIDVTGDAEDTVDGDRGTIYIEEEGEGLTLEGEGFWGDPEYDDDGYDDVDYEEPDNPVGDSGEYNIDWTRPEFSVSPRPKKEWRNDTLYDVDVDIYDELSGIDTGTIELEDSSHYGRDDTVDIDEGGNHDFSHTFELDDGIYSISIDATDIATNDYQKTYKTYYIDGTQPEIDFNIKNQIFSEDAGAIRKPSILGCDDSFYGKLTCSDNLSGVKSIQYKWTYGNKKPTSGYTRIYTSEDTYYDRYQEKEVNEIEKPVGDDLYLHVEVYDVAGNYTYKSFGPFEDPIKLINFQLTDIRDPRWISVFWNDNSYQNYKNFTYKVNALPVDEESHPTLKNALPKKGYAFYFDITSEYLYREKDRIEIKPTFYYLKGNQRIRADAYYSNNNNPLVQFGTNNDNSEIYLDTKKYGNVLIGGYNKLTLTKGVRVVKGREWINGWKDEIQYSDGKIQWWYGKYFIPSSTFFVQAGDLPMPYNKLTGGKILINFEIIGYKNGVETFSISQIYNYNNNRWNVEGGPKNSKYFIGDTIIYNSKYGLTSDKRVSVIH